MLYDNQALFFSQRVLVYSASVSSYLLFLLSSFPFQYLKIARLASELCRRTGISLISTGLAAGSYVLEIQAVSDLSRIGTISHSTI